jgi:hypothetical protein
MVKTAAAVVEEDEAVAATETVGTETVATAKTAALVEVASAGSVVAAAESPSTQ